MCFGFHDAKNWDTTEHAVYYSGQKRYRASYFAPMQHISPAHRIFCVVTLFVCITGAWELNILFKSVGKTTERAMASFIINHTRGSIL
jgi:hypothetical protein